MKIYTKKGDKGKTSLIGGQRVLKYDDRVEAYGTIDELKSYIGLIREMASEDCVKAKLLKIQERLFVAESRVACDSEEALAKMPNLIDQDIHYLESEIDRMNKALPELNYFILPGGSVLAAHTHIARTICRRAERATLKAFSKDLSDEMVLKYLNRLSDFLFVLARYLAQKAGHGDVIWKTN